MIPNHKLLEELAKRGGSSGERVGDFDVIRDYFAELGAGTTHRVRVSVATPRAARLSSDERAQIVAFQRSAAETTEGSELLPLADELFRLWTECNRGSRALRIGDVGVDLFGPTPNVMLTFKENQLAARVKSESEFGAFVLSLEQTVWENRDYRLLPGRKSGEGYPIESIAMAFGPGFALHQVHILRNAYGAHDSSNTVANPMVRRNMERAEEIVEAKVGVRLLQREDSRWCDLQRAVLESVCDSLRRIVLAQQAYATPVIPADTAHDAVVEVEYD